MKTKILNHLFFISIAVLSLVACNNKAIDSEAENDANGGIDTELGKTIEYVINANGTYSEEFLKSVGWKLMNEQDYIDFIDFEYRDNNRPANDIRRFTNYEMLHCELPNFIGYNDLKGMDAYDLQMSSRSRGGLEDFWLNTIGECTEYLNCFIHTMGNELSDANERFNMKTVELRNVSQKVFNDPNLHDLILKSLSQIDENERKYLSEKGLQIIDESYALFPLTNRDFNVEPVDCIDQSEKDLITKYKNIDRQVLTRKIWASSFQDSIKFYMQIGLDLAIKQAEYLTDIMNNSDNISCHGFVFEFNGIYSGDRVLDLLTLTENDQWIVDGIDAFQPINLNSFSIQ